MTMIEKMARAYWGVHWQDFEPEDQLAEMRSVRAALSVLMEPSEGMFLAANRLLCDALDCTCDEEAMFRAMIQAALDEEKTNG